MLSNNLQTIFPIEENDFVLVPRRFRVNFNVHSKHFLMEDRVSLLNDLCTASKMRLVEQMFINKI